MEKYVIVVAGGSGQRMQSETPKQFLLLNWLPILMRTMVAFFNYDNSLKIILVLPDDQTGFWKKLCIYHNFDMMHQIVSGGETRFHSVKNGLSLVKEKDSLVAVHDGVRPLVSQYTIQNCFNTATIMGNAVPAIEVTESIRILTTEGNQPLNRSDVKLIQTPQVFRADMIIKAYRQDYKESFTDDASVVENMGEKIHLIPGNAENIKITTKEDMIIASSLLNSVQKF